MPSPTVHGNYINGSWIPAAGGDTFENRNPASSDDVVGVFARSTAEDVRRAVDAARGAYDAWRLTPAPRRAEILYRAGQIMTERKEAMARDMTREMGKVLKE